MAAEFCPSERPCSEPELSLASTSIRMHVSSFKETLKVVIKKFLKNDGIFFRF